MMNSIELMVAEHDNILRFNQAVRNACAGILEGEAVIPADFHQMILFARVYADKHHHGKEEQILFKEMVDRLGKIGTNLITHGMLVEHDLGRLYISDLETAVNEYAQAPTTDAKLNIIANAIGYTQHLNRHIGKENEVVYVYAAKNLAPEVLAEVNAKTEAFEKLAEEDHVQKEYLDILKALEKKYSR